MTVTAPDALTRPFGAMIHLDYIAMERNSEASRAARYSLNVHDEKTSFRMAFPFHTRETEAVVDAMHQFDADIRVVRRWWTGAAPEFASAANMI